MKKLLRFRAVLDATGLKRSSLYRLIAARRFPRPIQLGERMAAWPSDEVEAFIAVCVRGASAEELRALVQQLEAARREAA